VSRTSGSSCTRQKGNEACTRRFRVTWFRGVLRALEYDNALVDSKLLVVHLFEVPVDFGFNVRGVIDNGESWFGFFVRFRVFILIWSLNFSGNKFRINFGIFDRYVSLTFR
jgi:hypothetical protein